MALNATNAKGGSSSFGTKSRSVTPNDSADLNPAPVKAVVCLTSGNISVIPTGNADNAPVAFVGVSAGFVPPFQVRRVMATGTTCTVRTIEG
ncbi:MAG: hypothetical protein JWP32_2952 [Schumannella sp.]|nr:hypothetical protein [Schumannella sp.]